MASKCYLAVIHWRNSGRKLNSEIFTASNRRTVGLWGLGDNDMSLSRGSVKGRRLRLGGGLLNQHLKIFIYLPVWYGNLTITTITTAT
jgi:hypothetical protein